MGTNLPEAVKNLTEPITKLVETIAAGIGKIYEPTHIERMAKAKAKEIYIITDAMRNNTDIPIKYANSVVSLDASDVNELASRTAMRLGNQELKKQQNIENVILKTKKELELVDEVSEAPVEPDWATRFMNSIEDVSNNEMQEVWSKILAGEIKRPKSFSLRTLECVKNLSPEEANLFQMLSQYFVSVSNEKVFLPREKDLLAKYGITYDQIIKLGDCGLINIDTGLSLEKKLSKDDRHYNIYNDRILIDVECGDDASERNCSLWLYRLTGIGAELYKAIGQKTNDSYMIDYAKELKKRMSASHLSVSAYNIIGFSEDGISCEKNNLIAGTK